MAGFEIRSLRSLDEMRPVVELQKVYWGDNVESVVPAHMLFSLANHGGHVLAAYEDDRLIGMLVGFLGTNIEDSRRPAMANLQLVSKRMVVLPEYRGHGVGYKLKLAQRDLAITQGVRLIVWTFDPLLSLNAHLNVRKLGAICTAYTQNYYGTADEGGLAKFGMSDRLMVEWWVTNRRVEERLNGTRSDLSLNHYLEADTRILNPATVTSDGLLLPAEQVEMPSGSLALIEIPTQYAAIESSNEQLARAWRVHIRDVFTQLFARAYIVTDFLIEQHEGRERSFYLMSYSGPQFESFSVN